MVDLYAPPAKGHHDGSMGGGITSNINLGSTAWPAWTSTGQQITLPDCEVDDLLLVGVAGYTSNANTGMSLEVATLVAAAHVNAISSGGLVSAGCSGFPGCTQWPGTTQSGGHFGDELWYRVQANDLDGTDVVLQLVLGCINNNAKILYRQFNASLIFWAKNYGQIPIS